MAWLETNAPQVHTPFSQAPPRRTPLARRPESSCAAGDPPATEGFQIRVLQAALDPTELEKDLDTPGDCESPSPLSGKRSIRCPRPGHERKMWDPLALLPI